MYFHIVYGGGRRRYRGAWRNNLDGGMKMRFRDTGLFLPAPP